MSPPYPRDTQEGKSQRRSRLGCRNCKLRKLKCDESKPQCRRCRSFGVTCNFLPGVSDLQLVATHSRQPRAVHGKAGVEAPLTNAVWTSDASTTYQLNAECQDLIARYLGRSLITPGDPKMVQLNRQLLELAFTRPYLMHASLAVALAYDRYRNGSLGSPRSVEECYHWAQSTVLLNRRLRQPIKDEDRDPIWGTAAALALQTYSSPEARTPEQAWPMKTSEVSDLDWLRMSEAKMSLWNAVNPLRPDSIYSVLAAVFAHMSFPMPAAGIEGVPPALAAVCDLADSSSAETSPYFHAAHAVSQILSLPAKEISNGHTSVFTGCIHGAFKVLLLGRDPVALLLLYLWYRKIGRSIWWIELRARVECPAICLYLRMYHRENVAVHAFLPGGAVADT